MGVKSKYPPELKRLSIKGDQILCQFVKEQEYGFVNKFKSNEFLCKYYDPRWSKKAWSMKGNSKPSMKSKIGRERYADMVEARIAWLFENFGEHTARTYFLKGVTKFMKEIGQIN